MYLPFSILDFVPAIEGSSYQESLQNVVTTAQFADSIGLHRIWYTEHHNFAAVSSPSTQILITHAANHTERIRIGAGGIMLPNHPPLRVAEDFKTLNGLFPDRIDLGLGRAPGTNAPTLDALRADSARYFPTQVEELIRFAGPGFPPEHAYFGISAYPGHDISLPPLWILGSSGASATFAGQLGAGYSFGTHFSSTDPMPAIEAYRDAFTPSKHFAKPTIILAVELYLAETEQKAHELADAACLLWVHFAQNASSKLLSPHTARLKTLTSTDRLIMQRRRALQFIGTPDTVSSKLQDLINRTGADEIIVSSHVWDQERRRALYQLLIEEVKLTPCATPKAA